MLIREGGNSIEIVVADRVPEPLPTAGDTQLSIEVRSAGFVGAGTAWIELGRLQAFVGQLRELEAHRLGSAELDSMSPGQFRLRLVAIDRAGHIAVEGRLARDGQALEFRFGICPSLMPGIVAEFATLCEVENRSPSVKHLGD